MSASTSALSEAGGEILNRVNRGENSNLASAAGAHFTQAMAQRNAQPSIMAGGPSRNAGGAACAMRPVSR